MKKKITHSLVAAAAAIFALQNALAGGFHQLQTGVLVRCPSCNHTCKPEYITKKVKKTTYEVECKQICIPAVTFPWQKCCEPRCGKVITVKKLKKVSYQCERCGCKWKIEPCGCDSCTSKGPVHAAKVKIDNRAVNRINTALKNSYQAPPLPPVIQRSPIVEKQVR